MFYTVYKTTNTVNGKIYIGAHRTENLEDGYVGSGNRLATALKKYGRSSFTKEILFVFDNPTKMSAKEAELVTREFVDREDTYNLVPGGYQGDSFYQTRKNITPEMMSAWGQKGNDAQRVLAEQDPHYRDASRSNGRAVLTSLREAGYRPPNWSGKRHSEASKLKLGATMRSLTLKEGNPQFGKSWVWKSGEAPRMVPREDIPSFIASGWELGRGLPNRKPRPSRAKPK